MIRGAERLSESRRPRTIVRVLAYNRSLHRPDEHERRAIQEILLSQRQLPHKRGGRSVPRSNVNTHHKNKHKLRGVGAVVKGEKLLCVLYTDGKVRGYGYTLVEIPGCEYGYGYDI